MSQDTSTNLQVEDYSGLTPDLVLQAVESHGLLTDGRLLALNSYENRVYQVGIEEAEPIIAKFYRPLRWSDKAINEEHDFSSELAESELPVVAPLRTDGRAMHTLNGYRFSLYARQAGHWPELGSQDEREWMGRFLARLHAIGALKTFSQRRSINIDETIRKSSAFLLEQQFIPAHIETAYKTLADDLLGEAVRQVNAAGSVDFIRLHGDCHPGNVLWTEDGPHFVDLDDCCNGPAIQDLWMLLSGERHDRQGQLIDMLEGYLQFREFDHRELLLIEPLRTMRIIHYAAWLARRWNDPAFPAAFPWFNTNNYWEGHVLALREQASQLAEPPLAV